MMWSGNKNRQYELRREIAYIMKIGTVTGISHKRQTLMSLIVNEKLCHPTVT